MKSVMMQRRVLLRGAAVGCLGGLGAVGSAVAVAAKAPSPPDLDPLRHPAHPHVNALTSVILGLANRQQRILAVGERGTLLLSEDGGRQWRQCAVPVSVSLTGASFGDDRHAWVVGHGQVVLHSADGGQTWERQLDGHQVAQLELKAALASGDAQQIRTAQQQVRAGADLPFLDVHFFDAQHGLVIGAYGSILVTRDGGRTWRSRRADVPNPGARHLYQLHVCGDAVAPQVWICGEQGLLVRARGHDAVFERVQTPYGGTFFGMVSTADAVLVFGLRGNLWRSVDEGIGWVRVATPAPVTLTGGAAQPGRGLVLVNEAGGLLRSTDDGASVRAVTLAKAAAFTDVLWLPDGALVMASARGPLRHPPFDHALPNGSDASVIGTQVSASS